MLPAQAGMIQMHRDVRSRLHVLPAQAGMIRELDSRSGPFPVWWTLVRFAVPDRVKGS